YPTMRIGFGELSPWGTIEYVREVLACPGPRIRADFLAVHPYQFAADPLSPWGKDVQTGLGPWFGIGRLAEMHRLLRQPTTRRRLSTPG
ncbi:hypothetical protein ACJBTM_10505, partial [Streptococcus suis]